MLDSFGFCVVVGMLLGFLAGLGVGGGSLLMLWLTIILGVGQSTARSINLLFFIPSAVTASLFRIRHMALPVKRILPALVTGPIAAAAATWIGLRIDTEMLRTGFGVLLLITGVRELFYKPKG